MTKSEERIRKVNVAKSMPELDPTKEVKGAPDLNTILEVDTFNSEYIDRVNIIIRMQGTNSDDECSSYSKTRTRESDEHTYVRPKKTARTEKTRTLKTRPITTTNKFGLLQTEESTLQKQTKMSCPKIPNLSHPTLIYQQHR